MSSSLSSTKNTNLSYGFYFDIENQTNLNGEDILFLTPQKNKNKNNSVPLPHFKPINKLTINQINQMLTVPIPIKPTQEVFPSFLGIVCVIFTVLNMFR